MGTDLICRWGQGIDSGPVGWGIIHADRQSFAAQKGNQFFSVAPTDSVRHAIEIMATRHVGALLVMASGPSPEAPPVSLAGIISERDYARKVILKNRSSQDTAVSEIMTSPAVTVAPTDSVRHCMEIMTQGRFRHLPVVEAGRVVGILSIGDLVKAVIEEQTAQIEQLERYIAGLTATRQRLAHPRPYHGLILGAPDGVCPRRRGPRTRP